MSNSAADIALYNSRTPGAPEQPKPSRWADLVLENGWAPLAGQRPPQVRQDSQGNVYFQGNLDGTAATSDQFTTLGTTNRPLDITVSIAVPVTAAAGIVNKELTIGLDGVVNVVGAIGEPGMTSVSITFFSNRFHS